MADTAQNNPIHNASNTPPLLRWRILISIIIGLAGFGLSYHQLEGRASKASDFTYTWRGARNLLAGHNPYHDPSIGKGHPYPDEAALPYPLPAVLFATPFASFPPYLAGALFFAVSAAILAFALTHDGWWRLTLLLSPCFFVAASVAQWSPLIVASAFLPALLPMILVKPNIAIPVALFHYQKGRGWTGVLLCVLVLLISLWVLPSWPADWFSNIAGQPGGRYRMPYLVIPGPLLLLALLRWRNRSARLLLLLAAVPQHFFYYDQLPLWLLARTVRESLLFSIACWIGYFGLFQLVGGDPLLALVENYAPNFWSVTFVYLPALALVLFQKEPEKTTGRLIE